MAGIGSSRFAWLLIGSAAISVTVISIIGILITVGYLNAGFGLAIIVLVIAGALLYIRLLLAGETVRTYQQVPSKAELIADAQAPARYVIGFIFGALMFGGALFFSTPVDLGWWYYFLALTGLFWMFAAMWGWFARGKTVARIQAEPDAKIIAKQKAGLVGAVAALAASYYLSGFGWSLFVLILVCICVGALAGFIAYRILAPAKPQ